MRYVKMHKGETFNSHDVLRTIIENAPKGMNLVEMRQRMRILDLLANPEADHILIEEADYAVLKTALQNFSFSIVHADIIAIADAVEGARAAPSLI